MKPSTLIYGWTNLPENQSACSESRPQVPFFLIMAASHTPAQAASTRKILLYLYCLVLSIHLARRH